METIFSSRTWILRKYLIIGEHDKTKSILNIKDQSRPAYCSPGALQGDPGKGPWTRPTRWRLRAALNGGGQGGGAASMNPKHYGPECVVQVRPEMMVHFSLPVYVLIIIMKHSSITFFMCMNDNSYKLYDKSS